MPKQRTIDEIFTAYERRIKQTEQLKEILNQTQKNQEIVLNEINKILSMLNRYIEINQQILTEISNAVYESEKSHAIIISLLFQLRNSQGIKDEGMTQDDIIKMLLKKEYLARPLKQDINIKTNSGDASVNNAGRDVDQEKR